MLGVPLAEHQRREIETAGGRLVDVDSEEKIDDTSYIVFDDHVMITRMAVVAIIATAKRSDRSLQFCLADNTHNRRYALPSSCEAQAPLRFPVYYRHADSETLEECLLPQRVYMNWTQLPGQLIPDGRYHMDQCDTLLASMDSPFHLLQANMYLNMAQSLWARKLWRPDRNVPNLYRKSYYRSLRLLNRFGRGCRIHPTAVVEGCVLGDDVTIGAHAVIRLSTIGRGSTIDDQASVVYSVLGANNYIANKNHIAFCLTYDGVFLIHGPYQFSVFGRDSAVFATINCDVRMDRKTIRIETQHGKIDSRQHLLGIAYGHGAKVAGGNILGPGQIVPNAHTQLPPDFIVNRVP